MDLIKEREKFTKERDILLIQLQEIRNQIVRRDGIIAFLTIKIEEIKNKDDKVND